MNNIGQRLKEIRVTSGITQEDFGDSLGLPWHKIKDIEEEKHPISGWWLLTGKGDKKIGSINENITAGNITQNGNNILQTGNGTNIALLSPTSIDEICDLIKNYATPKILTDLKRNLQKIKEAHPL